MWKEETLEGKIIIDIRVKSPSVWLQVKDEGWIEIRAEADCCSEAFIDSTRLENVPTLTGKSVEITYPAKPTSQDVDEITALKLLGGRGSVTIVHRNSSNGYYGNSLVIIPNRNPPEDAVKGREWYRDLQKESGE